MTGYQRVKAELIIVSVQLSLQLVKQTGQIDLCVWLEQCVLL